MIKNMLLKKAALGMACVLTCVCMCACGKTQSYHGDFYPYDLTSFVKLGNYNKISYDMGVVNINGDDVDEKVKSELKRFKLTTQKETDTAVVTGNIVDIDYVGYIDGKEFSGGSAKGFLLEIGSGQFIPGFESGLIGKKKGEKATLNLSFPENYSVNKSYSGKTVRFDVTVNRVLVEIYPELTDELVGKISTQKTVDSYKTYIYDSLVESKTEEIEEQNRNNLVEAVIGCCEIKKYPRSEVKKYQNQLIKIYTDQAGKQGMTFEQLFQQSGLTEKEFKTNAEDAAKKLVAKEMIFLMIADKEKLKLSDEEFEQGIKEYMEKGNYVSEDALFDNIGSDKLQGLLLVDKAVDYIAAQHMQ